MWVRPSRLKDVDRVVLGRGDVVVVDKFAVSALTDQPFVRERRLDGHWIDCRPVHHYELGCEEGRATDYEQSFLAIAALVLGLPIPLALSRLLAARSDRLELGLVRQPLRANLSTPRVTLGRFAKT